MSKTLIDFGELEHYIKEIEGILQRLNIVEQELVLKQAFARLERKVQEQKMNDLTSNNPLVRMAKKFLPKEDDEDN